MKRAYTGTKPSLIEGLLISTCKVRLSKDHHVKKSIILRLISSFCILHEDNFKEEIGRLRKLH